MKPKRPIATRAALALIALILAITIAPAAAASELFPKILPLPDGWQPEGIATGRGTDYYVGSLANGAIWKGDLRTGDGHVLNAGAPGRRIAGVKVDRRTNYVFGAGTGSGKAYVFNGDTGALLKEYTLTTATPTFINDVVITRDAAWFTDSNQPVLYKLPLGPGGSLPADSAAVEPLALGGDYQHVPNAFNANGIDAPFNGKALIIIQSVKGLLFTVDPATGLADQVDLGGATLPNGDGLLLDGKTLYVVQNRLNKIAVIDLKLTTNSGALVKELTDPAFRVPTTVAQFGPWLYAVNARFGTPPTPETEYEAVQVAK